MKGLQSKSPTVLDVISSLGAVRPLGPLRQGGARLAVAVHSLLGLALAEIPLVDDALSDIGNSGMD